MSLVTLASSPSNTTSFALPPVFTSGAVNLLNRGDVLAYRWKAGGGSRCARVCVHVYPHMADMEGRCSLQRLLTCCVVALGRVVKMACVHAARRGGDGDVALREQLSRERRG